MSKEAKITNLVNGLLKTSMEGKEPLMRKALMSGAIDAKQWDEDHNPMILPKIIARAILLELADNLDAKGTTFEKEVEEGVDNLRPFL